MALQGTNKQSFTTDKRPPITGPGNDLVVDLIAWVFYEAYSSCETPVILSYLFFLPSVFFQRHFHLRDISMHTVFPVSRFMRSDVKMNLLVKLFSLKGKRLNHNFFFGTDLVLSQDKSMSQARNGKS